MQMNSDFRDRVLCGDRHAEAFLIAALTPVFHKEVKRTATQCNAGWILNDFELQKDLVQQSFMGVFDRDRASLRKWNPTRGDAKGLLSYLSYIAKRTTLNHKTSYMAKKRGGGRPEILKDPLDGFPECWTDDRENPERRTADKELVAILSKSVAKQFSKRGQKAFSMLYLFPRPTLDICKELDTTIGSVHTWNKRLKQHLRTVLRDLGETEGLEQPKCA